MTATLLPTPSPRSWDPDIDSTLARCREDWLQPDALGKLADRWLCLARLEPKAVDAVIKFAKSAPPQWQATVALTWIETIVDERYDLFANHLWLLVLQPDFVIIGVRGVGGSGIRGRGLGVVDASVTRRAACSGSVSRRAGARWRCQPDLAPVGRLELAPLERAWRA